MNAQATHLTACVSGCLRVCTHMYNRKVSPHVCSSMFVCASAHSYTHTNVPCVYCGAHMQRAYLPVRTVSPNRISGMAAHD